MPEHAHLIQTKRTASGPVEVHTVVRRKGLDDEVRVVRSMGYDVDWRYCGDPSCLGPEPPSRLMGERA